MNQQKDIYSFSFLVGGNLPVNLFGVIDLYLVMLFECGVVTS